MDNDLGESCNDVIREEAKLTLRPRNGHAQHADGRITKRSAQTEPELGPSCLMPSTIPKPESATIPAYITCAIEPEYSARSATMG